MNKPLYNDYGSWLRRQFPFRVQKISIDAGFSCPNRDGTLGTRGCSFCSAGGSGNFAADRSRSVTEQLCEAKSRIAAKTNARHFIAYFQAYTNTYADISYLRTVFSESLQPEEIVALSIATRVDCLPDEVLALLCELRDTFHKPVWIELGIQSTFDASLRHVRSGFTYADCEQAIRRLHHAGIPVIAHLILGLPGETQAQMLQSIMHVCRLPIAGLKLQLLHILKDTDLAAEYKCAPFPVFSEEAYCQFIVTCIEHIPSHIVLHRITGDGPKRLLIAPLWSGNKKHVLNRIHAIFRERDTWQGKYSTL